MHKKKNKNKTTKIILICISALLVFICLFFSLKLDRKVPFIEKIFKDTTSFVNKAFMYPFTGITKEKGVNQTDSLKLQKEENKALKEEIEDLKKTLKLKETYTEYETINAGVLNRNKGYWFQTITIDKGTKSGIEEGYAVVTKEGLIGKISKVSHNSSEVKLITSDDINYKISVSIRVNGKDHFGILNGYDPKTKCLKVVDVNKTAEVKKDNVVSTSGLASNFPKGIYIGKIDKIEMDKYDISKTLYIKTTQDFNEIHYVTVLKKKVS